jgi:hypothetical protein
MMRVLFLMFPLLGFACAFSNVNVIPPKQPVAANLSGGKNRTVQVIVPLADARPQRNRCGMQKNGFNMDTANVICSAEPTTWLAELLATELRASGFAVLPSTSASATAVRLEGQLLQYFIEPKVGFFTFSPEADIHVRLVATTSSGLLAERDFYVKGEQTAIFGIESVFQSASDTAVRQIVKDMVQAMIGLMDRYPDLGTDQVGTPAS